MQLPAPKNTFNECVFLCVQGTVKYYSFLELKKNAECIKNSISSLKHMGYFKLLNLELILSRSSVLYSVFQKDWHNFKDIVI